VVNPLSSELTYIVVSIAIVLLSLTVHEAAHAWSADRLGDPTARVLGRVSLNPMVHIDLVGTILLPIIAAVSNFPIIGWAKPVPVNTSRLAHPRRDFMIVAAAGPASNIALAVLGAVLVQLLPSPTGFRPSDGLDVTSVLFMAGSINIFLAVFNLVPIPPLDGGNVLAGLLPPNAAEVLDRLRPFGFLILYAMMFTGVLGDLIVPPARFLLRLLFP
jgi:Zn-dependent protease